MAYGRKASLDVPGTLSAVKGLNATHHLEAQEESNKSKIGEKDEAGEGTENTITQEP